MALAIYILAVGLFKFTTPCHVTRNTYWWKEYLAVLGFYGIGNLYFGSWPV
jgi:hypothetical protein